MGAKKIIKNIIEFLDLPNFTVDGKRKALKDLLAKLKKKRVKVLRELKKELEIEDEKKLKEELELLSFHIKKAKKKLTDI